MEATKYLLHFDGGDKKPPRWMRTISVFIINTKPVTPETILVPAAIAGNQDMVFLCVTHSATPIIKDGKHLYVTAAWIRKEFPDVSNTVTFLLENVFQLLLKQEGEEERKP